MFDQKINITLTADNSDLKKAVEDSTNKLLHLGESGQEAMDRTASTWDDFLWKIPMATAAHLLAASHRRNGGTTARPLDWKGMQER